MHNLKKPRILVVIFMLALANQALSQPHHIVKDQSVKFRKILQKIMKKDGFTPEQVRVRALRAPSELMNYPHVSSDYTPLDLYDGQEELPELPVAYDDQGTSQKGPAPIIIVFPGVGSDLLDVKVFSNVTGQASNQVELSLPAEQTGRVSLANLRNTEDQVILHIINLQSPKTSMESFLPPLEQAKIFRKSIDKLWEASGFTSTKNDVYFLGYSRGSLPALKLLHQVSKEKRPPKWYRKNNGKPRLKGFISLSGSLNGSFADAIGEKHSILKETGELLEQSLGELVPAIEAFDKNYSIIFGTAETIEGSIINSILNLLEEIEGVMPFSTAFQLNFSFNNGGIVFPKLTDKRIAEESNGRSLQGLMNQTNLDKILALAEKVGGDFIFLDGHILYNQCPDDQCRQAIKTKYEKTINSLKKLRHIIPGLAIMQSEQLLEFWKSLNLPNHIKYISLSATMPTTFKDFHSRPTPGYQHAYDSLFYKMDNLLLRVPFYAYVDNMGELLNDGQVSVKDSTIKPEYLALGSGKSYDVTHLGVVGATHWELAFENVFASPTSWQKPRQAEKKAFHESLVKALAAFLSNDDN